LGEVKVDVVSTETRGKKNDFEKVGNDPDGSLFETTKIGRVLLQDL